MIPLCEQDVARNTLLIVTAFADSCGRGKDKRQGHQLTFLLPSLVPLKEERIRHQVMSLFPSQILTIEESYLFAVFADQLRFEREVAWIKILMLELSCRIWEKIRRLRRNAASRDPMKDREGVRISTNKGGRNDVWCDCRCDWNMRWSERHPENSRSKWRR